jgi:hypothetical protein
MFVPGAYRYSPKHTKYFTASATQYLATPNFTSLVGIITELPSNERSLFITRLSHQ